MGVAEIALRPRAAPSAEEVLRQRAAFLIGAIANRLVAAGSELYRRHFGIGFTEWRVMVMLALEPGIPARRISEVVGLDKAAVSRGLKGLEQRGLIVTTTGTAGRRSREYVLTDEGQALYAQVLKVSREHERLLLADLGRAEAQALIGALQKLYDQLPAIEGFAPSDLPPLGEVRPKVGKGAAAR